VTRERLLVNFFYAHPVGHAVEALHYCQGHHAAAPERLVSVALNAASACELAAYCPFVESVYAIEHPFVEPCRDSARALAAVPRHWDWVVDDFRALLAAHQGDASRIWSIDGVHFHYVGAARK
jgi:hypothetical protein